MGEGIKKAPSLLISRLTYLLTPHPKKAGLGAIYPHSPFSGDFFVVCRST
nr:MAG TPA: hypothetical protein [Caudoviricetes sp.]